MIGKTISHYKITAKLGAGGMGDVFLAEDTRLQRKVALKFLPEQFSRDQDAHSRFQREARALAALNHANIVAVHDISEHENRPYIVMEYVDGQTLKTLCETSELEIDTIVDLGIQIGDALSAAHAARIVHRDLKPANVLIGKPRRVKVADFGLAMFKGVSGLTKEQTTVGTIHYMSPEQTGGEPVDHRTDIWSFGVLLYQMLTRSMPFKGDYDQAIIYSILNEEPIPMTRFRHDVPAVLTQLVGKALEKDPHARHAHIDDILAGLNSLRDTSGKPGTGRSQPSTERRPSIAVLPFVNLSADAEQEYFGDGIAEEIINALMHIEGLHVAARTSAFAFKDKRQDIREIGRTLNVTTVLEGSVRKAGHRLRITAQLINVADGYHLWSERFDRKAVDVFDIQDEIALAIVAQLRLRLLPKEKAAVLKRSTDSLEAHNLYLKGRFFWNKRGPGLKRAIEFFEQARTLDPDYAPAYAGIADAYLLLGFYAYLPSGESLTRARKEAQRALELDPSLVEAYSCLAFVKLMYDWDWPGARAGFERAVAINPAYAPAHYWFASYHQAMGDHEAAIAQSRQAVEIDPLSVFANTYLGYALLGARRAQEGIEALLRALEMDPGFVLAHWLLGHGYRMSSQYELAMAETQEAVKLSQNHPWMLENMAECYAIRGLTDKAREILAQLEERSRTEYVRPSLFAALHICLHEFDQGFAWLDTALNERDVWMTFIRLDPSFDPVRSDPRFDAVLEKIGLP